MSKLVEIIVFDGIECYYDPDLNEGESIIGYENALLDSAFSNSCDCDACNSNTTALTAGKKYSDIQFVKSYSKDPFWYIKKLRKYKEYLKPNKITYEIFSAKYPSTLTDDKKYISLAKLADALNLYKADPVTFKVYENIIADFNDLKMSINEK